MSHAATNWAIQQRGLKPATKIVLWHLCDRHNPDQGCYPSQDRLADDCEMSRSALNEHLKLLEAAGLIRREQRIDPVSKRQQSTRYLFAFEADFHLLQDVVEPCPETGHGAVSGKEMEPSPDSAESRVLNPDTNPVREPVREPRGALARAGEGDFDILWSSWPEKDRPDSRETARRLFDRLSSSDRAKAIRGAQPYRTAMVRRSKPPRMINYLRSNLFVDFYDEPEIDESGRFVSRPGRPEWSAWLGDVRGRYGQRGVDSVVKCGLFRTLTRWPEDLSLAQQVTRMAPSGADMAAE